MASGGGFWQQQRQQYGYQGRGGGRHPHMTPRVRDPQFEEEESGELPSVDDLEVAAAAAQAATADQTFLSQVSQYDAARIARLRAAAAAGDDTSSSDEDSDEDMEVDAAAAAAPDAAAHVTVSLKAEGDHVRVELRAVATHHGSDGVPLAGMRALKLPENEKANKGAASSDDEEPEDMQVALERMIAAASDDEGDKGIPAIDPEVLPPLAAAQEQIVIDPGEPLLPAGAVSAMVEGMIVVQARELMRALDIESVLCLTDRTPLGRVEEVFGPVSKPLYALRYAGPGKVEDVVHVGAPVYVAEGRAVFVNAAEAQRQEVRPVFTEDGEDDEVAFSDDEHEQEWLRQRSKRAAAEGGAVVGARPAKAGGGRGQRPTGRGRSGGRGDGGCGGAGRGGRFGGRTGGGWSGGGGGGRQGGVNYGPDNGPGRGGRHPGGLAAPPRWPQTQQQPYPAGPQQQLYPGGGPQSHPQSQPSTQPQQQQQQQQRFGASGVRYQHQQFEQPQPPQQQRFAGQAAFPPQQQQQQVPPQQQCSSPAAFPPQHGGLQQPPQPHGQQDYGGHLQHPPQHPQQQQGFGRPPQFQAPPGMQLVPLQGIQPGAPPPQPQQFPPQPHQQRQQQQCQQPQPASGFQPAASGFQPVLLPSGHPAMVLPGVPLTLPAGQPPNTGQRQQQQQPSGLYSSGMR